MASGEVECRNEQKPGRGSEGQWDEDNNFLKEVHEAEGECKMWFLRDTAQLCGHVMCPWVSLGALGEAVEQDPSLLTLLIFITVLCSSGGKVGLALVRGTASEVCHFKCKMGSDSLGMGMCCPVTSLRMQEQLFAEATSL